MQYIGVQACDTCIVFYILSCTANAGVPYKQEQLLAAMSTEHPIHLFHSFFQPQLHGDGSSCSATSICPQTRPAWYAALLACSISAAFVGGSSSGCSNFLVNNCWIVLFTECSSLVLSYSNTMNLSKKLIDSLMEEGSSAL